jgi:hypothetical protein
MGCSFALSEGFRDGEIGIGIKYLCNKRKFSTCERF